MKPAFVAALLIALVAVEAGCTDNRATFFVRDIKVPTDECLLQSDRNAPYRSSGVLDLAIRDNYILTPLMENAMTSSTKLNPTSAESNRIQVSGAQVRIGLEDGTDVSGGDFFINVSAMIEPGGVTSVGFTGIPSGYMAGVPAGSVVIVEFRMLGTTQGGKEVDTPWFAFPVTTCEGCLVFFSPESWDDVDDCYDCNSVGTGGDISQPCWIGQDELVDCRLCASINPGVCTDTSCP